MKSKLIILMLLVTSVSSCGAMPTSMPSTTMPTLRSTTTLLPTVTATNVPATLTPISTLTADDSRQILFSLLETNGDCELPCIFGFTPGQNIVLLDNFVFKFGETTSEQTIISSHKFEKSGGFISLLRENQLATRVYLSYYPAANGKTSNQITLHLDSLQEKGYNADLSNANLSPIIGDPVFNEHVRYYMLSNILSTFGTPSNILVAAYPNDPLSPGSEPFSVVIMYEQQGFFIEYVSFRQSEADYYIGCPWRSHVAVSAWDLNTQRKQADIFLKGGMVLNDTNFSYYKPIEEATSMTISDFVAQFSVPTKDCIRTPISMWKP